MANQSSTWYKCTSKKEALMTLGLGLNASAKSIKRAYKNLCKKYHPDAKSDIDLKLRKAMFLRINDAYDYLIEHMPELKGPRTKAEKARAVAKEAERENAGPRVYGSKVSQKDSAEKMKMLSKRAEEQKRALREKEFEKSREKANQIKSAERAAEIISDMMRSQHQEQLRKLQQINDRSKKN